MVIKEIRLLDAYLYEFYSDYIPEINTEWWLCSWGTDKHAMQFVDEAGLLNKKGKYIRSMCGVRPVLIINNITISPGDKIALFGYTWTVLNRDIVLCDSIISNEFFHTDAYDTFSEYTTLSHSALYHFLTSWLLRQKQKHRKLIHIKNNSEYMFLCSFCKKYNLNMPVAVKPDYEKGLYFTYWPCTAWQQRSDISKNPDPVITFSEFCDYIMKEKDCSPLLFSEMCEKLIKEINL